MQGGEYGKEQWPSRLSAEIINHKIFFLNHGDPVAMVLQDQSLLLKQVIDGVNVGVGQLKALDLDWVVAELVILGF